MSTAPAALPTYTLYGEAGERPATDWLHWESIAERSRRHQWEIRVHRHAALFQILYIHRGTGQATVDGQTWPLHGPCVLTVPALVPHGFRFKPGIDGSVFTVLQAHVKQLLGSAPALRDRVLQPRLIALCDEAAAAVARTATQLRTEFMSTQPWRALAIDAALCGLLVALERAAPRGDAQHARRGSRAALHLERYRELIDASYRTQPSLAALARQTGITPTQLNRVCRQLTGRSALALLHARVLLEAQRDLAYTNLSIKQVALGLGFGDAGYFTRFFQRLAGRTPTQWRGDAHAAERHHASAATSNRGRSSPSRQPRRAAYAARA
ncbi:MAG TPA: helix-turn-helix domain-containing protein [Burkholderiaceae bacterium]|nr:helix-turn-helix domain-containing protein [Burkholderiaceae bacterium]